MNGKPLEQIIETLRRRFVSIILSGSSRHPFFSQGPMAQERHMSSTSDKVKGMANEAVGNIKQGVGKVTDNDKLRAEGKAQEIKGEGQQVKGEVKDQVKKGLDH